MRHTHLKRIGLLVLAAVMGLMSLIASPARAEFAAVGPVSAPHGFPLYYTDSNDLSLELCLDADWCFFDPVERFQEVGGFGYEFPEPLNTGQVVLEPSVRLGDLEGGSAVL